MSLDFLPLGLLRYPVLDTGDPVEGGDAPYSSDLLDFFPGPPYLREMEVASSTAEYVFTAINVAVFIAAVVYALILGRKRRSLIPLMLMVGGVLAAFVEPLIDSHLQVWWPEHNQPDYISDVWGRNIPLFILIVCGWYFGVGSAVRWQWLTKHGAKAQLWGLYFAEVGAAIMLEWVAIQLDLWHYYGDHGLRLLGYPLWWPFVGAACAMAAGTVVYKLSDYLKGYRVVIAALLVPMTVAAVYWAAGTPMFLALNAALSPALMQLAALSSMALSLVVVWVCTIATGHHEYRREMRAQARDGKRAAAMATARATQL